MMNTIAHADIEMPEPMQSAIYHGIGDTLDYLAAHWQEQPSLDLLAKRAGWSLSHFQRAFTDHVGVSPKRVLQYLTIAHARVRQRAVSSTSTRGFPPPSPASPYFPDPRAAGRVRS